MREIESWTELISSRSRWIYKAALKQSSIYKLIIIINYVTHNIEEGLFLF